MRSERTEKDKAIKPAEEFLLTREPVVRFVQDSIASAVGRQKRNADRHGRANDLSFKVNDLVLLFTVNLPKRVVTMWVVINYYPYSLAFSVYCIAETMRTH